MARLNDALLRPILRWAEADLGPAPAPWAWLALGSEGRMEQTLLTDQDNALVFADEGGGARAWFQAFAERVNDDLEAAGLPALPGRLHGAQLARHARPSGADASAAGSDQPTPQGLLEAAIFFDHRRVAGRLDLEPLQEEIAAAARPAHLPARHGRGGAALRAAADAAPAPARRVLGGRPQEAGHLAHRLPGALLRARGGHPAPGTRSTGSTRPSGPACSTPRPRGNVSEAYRFLVGLRLRLQLRTLVEGRPVVDEVALSALTPVERTRLKESFRAVKAWQEIAAYHHRL